MKASLLFRKGGETRVDIITRLTAAGFFRVIALDAAKASDAFTHGTLLIALWRYDAEITPTHGEGWIHPYYFASQRAYDAAAGLVRDAAAEGAVIQLRDDVRLKPIFARLPDFHQGWNTLSYVEGAGSRFHAQTLWLAETLAGLTPLYDVPHERQCGSCRRCMEACPTGAIQVDGFHRERCLRYWMMSGQTAPEFIREEMGVRLIGCDDCQRCCPHNAPAGEISHDRIPLAELLARPKETALALRPLIGVNLTLPNRVLSQACIMAGSIGREDLLPLLTRLADHPSPNVRTYSTWAVNAITAKAK